MLRAQPTGSDAKLTPRLQQLTQPWMARLKKSAQAPLISLPASGAGSLQYSNGDVAVEIRLAENPTGQLAALRGAGARIGSVDDNLRMVSAFVAPSDLTAIAAVPAVASVQESLAPQVDTFGQTAACHGARTDEADAQDDAARARGDYGVDGTGETVGIISNSFASANSSAPTSETGDELTADLPGPGNVCGYMTPVQVLEEGPSGSTDEGRAMAQIVHDVAPAAKIDFATATGGQIHFADQIRALEAAGATAIADDVHYPDEPFFQDGPVGDAVDDVTAGSPGVAYFSSAGNANTFDSQGREIGSWFSPAFRPSAAGMTTAGTVSGACPVAVLGVYSGPGTISCENFDPSGDDNTDQLTIAAGGTVSIDLQWAEPWYGVTTDLDEFLLNTSGEVVATSDNDNIGPNGTQEPFEAMSYDNTSPNPVEVQLVIANRTGSGTPALEWAAPVDGSGALQEVEYPNSSGGDVVGPTVLYHASSPSAVAVAAQPADETAGPEPYSSRGPARHYFGPVTSSTPAAPLLNAPQVIAKPDVTAVDCGDNTVLQPFCGTSAAVPVAAGIAALARQALPAVSVPDLVTAMESSAQPVPAPAGQPANAASDVGSGLIDADAMLKALGAAPDPQTVPATPFFSTTDSITSSDPTSTPRLYRAGAPSGCAGSVSSTSTTGTYHYKSYGFQNLTNETQCIRVDLTPSPACWTSPHLIVGAGYSPAFDPASVNTNVVGNEGTDTVTSEPGSFFMSVPAGQAFQTVVDEVTADGGCSGYTLELDSLAPFAMSAPAVDGMAATGDTLTGTDGSWAGFPSFSAQWMRCDSSGGNCAAIEGADSLTYLPQSADVGSTLRLRITATDRGETSSADSAETAPVASGDVTADGGG